MPDKEIRSEWSVLKMLEWATDYLTEKNVNTPRLSVELLLAEVLSCKRLDLYLMYERPLNNEELANFKPMLLRRAKHEPIQYITGWTNFFGLRVDVSPSTLIPRPETEQLVELFLELHKDQDTGAVLDIGTGSGCIALAIKQEKPNWNVFGFDISDEALKMARKNADVLNLDVHFFRDDLFNPKQIPNLSFDCIISNPPYIHPAEKNTIDIEVKSYEPSIALFHEDVDSVYAAIEKCASQKLKSEGFALMELNENRTSESLSVFDTSNWAKNIKKDYSNKDRMLVCTLKKHT